MNIPYSPEIEQELIAALLFTPNIYNDLEDLLTPDIFYDTKAQYLFSAIQYQHRHNLPTDLVSIVQRLRDAGTLDKVGGMAEITNMLARTPSITGIKAKVNKLHELHTQRALIALTATINEKAQDGTADIADTLDELEHGLTALQMGTAAEAVSWMDCVQTFLKNLQEPPELGFTPISTGLDQLDRLLNGGFRSPDLVILGGRPSMGKTQFTIHFAIAAARQQQQVLFASIEMTAQQLVERVIGKGANPAHLRAHVLDEQDSYCINANLQDFYELPITIADSERIRHLGAIKSTARRLRRQGKLNLLVIDYLQLIITDRKFERRYIEVGHITRELKSLAKELHIPIILLAQLSRPLKGKEAAMPQMEDLRESGDIEQDADIILFPHRPAVFDPEAIDSSGRSWHNRGKIIVAKNREGQRGVECRFQHDEYFKTIYNDD